MFTPVAQQRPPSWVATCFLPQTLDQLGEVGTSHTSRWCFSLSSISTSPRTPSSSNNLAGRADACTGTYQQPLCFSISPRTSTLTPSNFARRRLTSSKTCVFFGVLVTFMIQPQKTENQGG